MESGEAPQTVGTFVYCETDARHTVENSDIHELKSDLVAGNNTVTKSISNISGDEITKEEPIIREDEDDTKEQIDDGPMTPFIM